MYKKDDFAKLKNNSIAELNQEVAWLKQELVSLKMDLHVGKLKNTGKIKMAKKKIAQIKTIINEKKLQGNLA